MKHLASNSRGSGGTAGCFDDMVASSLHAATSCHRVVPASLHTVTRFLRAETSRQHTVQAFHRAETVRHGIATAFLHTETFCQHTVTAFLQTETVCRGTETLRHHAVGMTFLHTCGNFVSTHRNFISPRGEIIFTRRKSSGGITLAQKQAKNGQNRGFCRSNRKP